MKKVGIVGGIGPPSTIIYYRSIIETFRARCRDDRYPHILINSVNLQDMLRLIEAGRWDDVVDFAAAELVRLDRAGVDFGLLASNTPHVVFDRIHARSPFPLLSIVNETRGRALDQGLQRVGLFGTRFTMASGIYQDAFAAHDMHVVLPSDEEQEQIHARYMDELVPGIVRDETRQLLLAIARRLVKDEGIEALILGGTELSLILTEPEPDLPFLDTTSIHVDSIVERLLTDP